MNEKPLWSHGEPCWAGMSLGHGIYLCVKKKGAIISPVADPEVPNAICIPNELIPELKRWLADAFPDDTSVAVLQAAQPSPVP